jgi:hypothetical protein
MGADFYGESPIRGVTSTVLAGGHLLAMNAPLKVGDLLHCPHCRRWHPVVKWHSEGTAYTLRMIYFDRRRAGNRSATKKF